MSEISVQCNVTCSSFCSSCSALINTVVGSVTVPLTAKTCLADTLPYCALLVIPPLQDISLRTNEKKPLKALNKKYKNSTVVRYPVMNQKSGVIKTAGEKVAVLLQAAFANLDIGSFHQSMSAINQSAPRVVQFLLEVVLSQEPSRIQAETVLSVIQVSCERVPQRAVLAMSSSPADLCTSCLQVSRSFFADKQNMPVYLLPAGCIDREESVVGFKVSEPTDWEYWTTKCREACGCRTQYSR